MNPTSRATATTPTTASAYGRTIATVAAAVLVGCALALALAGPALVPGAGADQPRWILGIFGEGLGLSPGLFLALMYVATIGWVALFLTGREWHGARWLWFLIGGLVTVFTLAPPLLSLDIFSYISYARLGAGEGLNPYEFAPADLRGDEVAERVDDFRFAVSVYGPLFTWLTYPLGVTSAGFALWTLKVVAGLSVLAIAVITARLARVRGVAPAPAAAFVALNPIVLVHLVGGAHNDGLMVAVALAGALWLVTARPVTAGTALVASAALKAAGALYVPFALLGAEGRRVRLLAGLLGAGLVIGGLALALFGTEVASALGVAGDNQQTVSRWSVPGTMARITDLDVDPIRYAFGVIYLATVLALLAWVWRGADWIRAAGWAAFGLLLATAWMVPWYLIWVLPFAAVSRDRNLIAGCVLLTLFQAINAVPV